MKIKQIVSGGQTGADRAALDIAMELGYEFGGWIPKGRLAEDGTIPLKYFSLKKCDSKGPVLRTELNVRDSDATLILLNGQLLGGSDYTEKVAVKLGKPIKHLDFSKYTIDEAVGEILEWLKTINGRVLNIAGPRQSEDSRIYSQVKEVLFKVLKSHVSNSVIINIEHAI